MNGTSTEYVKRHVPLKGEVRIINRTILVQFLREKTPFKKCTPISGAQTTINHVIIYKKQRQRHYFYYFNNSTQTYYNHPQIARWQYFIVVVLLLFVFPFFFADNDFAAIACANVILVITMSNSWFGTISMTWFCSEPLHAMVWDRSLVIELVWNRNWRGPSHTMGN